MPKVSAERSRAFTPPRPYIICVVCQGAVLWYSDKMTRTSGLLWKTPWRMSQNRKFRQRSRLQAVDTVISNLNISLTNAGLQCKALNRAIDETIPEKEMAVKDKYTLFSRSSSGYRKGVHKVPKFTKVPLPREGPRGF